jgi:uncharacterized protein (TIGR02453 family)
MPTAAAKTATPAKFTGFMPGTLEFYRGLAANNNQDWFNAHREQYMADVIAPAQAFVAAAGPKLQKLSPGVRFDLDHNGKGSIKKIFTDRRFNKDRDPYKTYMDIIFWEGPLGTKKDNSVFFFRLDPQQIILVAGLKYFERPVLKAYREAVADPSTGGELMRVLKKLEGHSELELLGRNLSQYPRGFDKELPQRDLLLHDALYAVHTEPVPKDLYTAGFVDYAVARWKLMAPLHRWLVDNVLARVPA